MITVTIVKIKLLLQISQDKIKFLIVIKYPNNMNSKEGPLFKKISQI